MSTSTPPLPGQDHDLVADVRRRSGWSSPSGRGRSSPAPSRRPRRRSGSTSWRGRRPRRTGPSAGAARITSTVGEKPPIPRNPPMARRSGRSSASSLPQVLRRQLLRVASPRHRGQSSCGAAAAWSRISSTTPGSASVVVSPRSRPSATSRSRRRMILPLRVLGRSSVKMTVLGRAMAPILVATCWRSSSPSSSAGLVAAPQDDEGDDRLAGGVVVGARRPRPRPPPGGRPAPTRPRWWRCGGPTRSSRRRPGRAARGSRRRRAWRRRRRSSGPRSAPSRSRW